MADDCNHSGKSRSRNRSPDTDAPNLEPQSGGLHAVVGKSRFSLSIYLNMKIKSYITWFEDDDYIGTKVSLASGSVWVLDTKIVEHEYYEGQIDVEELGIQSEARGVFSCSKVSGDGPSTAILKIRLQIPWIGTATKAPAIRAQQASSEPRQNFETEVDALPHLTKAHCSSTPSLIDWKREQQKIDEWVPGGYKLSILMEQLPGSDPSDLFISRRMERAERDALRAAFKIAWLEAINCGWRHTDAALRNLLWDKKGNKCYLVDWEYCQPAEEKDAWEDAIYIDWNLARTGESGNYLDMDDWDL